MRTPESISLMELNKKSEYTIVPTKTPKTTCWNRLPINLSKMRLLNCEAVWFSTIITIEKLNTVRVIIPAAIEDIILLAVEASRNRSQCNCDLNCFPCSEKSKDILRKERRRKAIAIIAGKKAMLFTACRNRSLIQILILIILIFNF